ncbi:unnamed protein product [Zymoseptoria tritici ST99CH_3D1]|nr:unnamed protein product [Zymoseptoria tritici ST99CH_3D1]
MSSPTLHPSFHRLPLWVRENLSPKALSLLTRVWTWVEEECIPAEHIYKAQLAEPGKQWQHPPIMLELRERAKREGLWNLFLPKHFGELSPGLTNLEYATMAEVMGRCYWAAQTMNCHAPDTGNMELLAKYASSEQKEKYLMPLLRGETFSSYSMTEPDVAASDATNIACRITPDPDDPDYLLINGRKLYGTVANNKDLGFYILMGCSDPENPDPWKRHTTVIVPKGTPGQHFVRNLTIMGYPMPPEGHGEFIYTDARIPRSNIILGPGRAFEIAQGRLGPGRIHHCMRLIGATERAYELALIRCTDTRFTPRGKTLATFDSNLERLADMRMTLDSLRQVVMNAAHTMDVQGNKAGTYAIAQSKVLVPRGCAKIIDECMQMYGGQGLTQHTVLPEMWMYARFVRVADGPDAAHRHQVGRGEVKGVEEWRERVRGYERRGAELGRKWGVEMEGFAGVDLVDEREEGVKAKL